MTFSISRKERQERAAVLASLEAILKPRTVAVIGASRREGSLGQLIFKALLEAGFSGIVYPVNPHAESVMSLRTYASINDVPGPVDLALIVVPAAAVNQVAAECGRKGVKALIVISDGFRERGPEGAARESQLLETARQYGMRLVGPNCMGVINTAPELALNATFSRIYPPHGNVGFLSQSGAMGLVILEYASSLNLGISTFISVGNRADVSSNDMLQYWEQDPATKVILLYLESFGNPRKFARITRRVTQKKPVVVVKGGSTAAGSRAASSHTGALASNQLATDALFRQAGIVRVETISQLFDVATLLSNQPLPRGRRLAIVTNGGGPGIIAADAAERYHLTLPVFPDELKAALADRVRQGISINNPLDLTAGATGDDFGQVLELIADSDAADAALAIFIPPTSVDNADMEKAIRHAAPIYHRQGKPLAVSFMGYKGFKPGLGTRHYFVPSYRFPGDAVLAFAHAVTYAEFRGRPCGRNVKPGDIKTKAAREIIAAALERPQPEEKWLTPQEISGLLQCYGINFVTSRMVRSATEAAEAARQIGFPVVLKLDSATITHKTDLGGVKLNLHSAKAVRQAYLELEQALTQIKRRREMRGAVVQPMVSEGLEFIIGMTHDPSFGPIIMFGVGGIYAEMVQDVAFRLHPLLDCDADELVRSIKSQQLLAGYRGTPARDVTALKDLLLRLSCLVEDLPEISDIDFNPVKVMAVEQGYQIVDGRIAVKAGLDRHENT